MLFTVTLYPHKFAIWYLLLQCILVSLLYGIYCYSVSSLVCYMVFTVTVYPHKFAIWYLLLQCILMFAGIYCYSVSS